MNNYSERTTEAGLDRRLRKVENEVENLRKMLSRSFLHMSEMEQLDFLHENYAFNHLQYLYYAQLKDIPRQYLDDIRERNPLNMENLNKIYSQYKVMAKMKE